MDLRTHLKEMMQLRKVVEQLKYRDKFVEWDSGRYSRLLKYMIFDTNEVHYRNQKICLLGMVNVPKHSDKGGKKDENSSLIKDSHIFRFSTKFTLMRCERDALSQHTNTNEVFYNSNF